MDPIGITNTIYAGTYTEWIIGAFFLFCLFLWTAIRAKNADARHFAVGACCVELATFLGIGYWWTAQLLSNFGLVEYSWFVTHKWLLFFPAQMALAGGLILAAPVLKKLGRYWLPISIGMAGLALSIGSWIEYSYG